MLETEKLTDKELADLAKEGRRLILKMIHAASSGHPGGALGMIDIFTVLYFDILRHNPANPTWEDRDRFLLSNGHISAARYTAMALAGYFPVEDLMKFRQMGSPYQGHPSTRYLPAVENSSGSLGQGLSTSVGLSLGLMSQNRDARVYVGISDGECGEGMIWEAAQAAVHHQAPILAFMDHNGIQIDGFCKDVCDPGDLAAKFAAFGWNVMEADGHDIGAIRNAFREMNQKTGPRLILFKTVLGKGVSFMENKPGWHGKPPEDEDLKKALAELA